MTGMIDRRFGTFRGLVRLALAYAELATGRLAAFHLRQPAAVKRLVFVCQGNICRSAYADRLARDLGLSVASLGLSTTTGAASPPEAVASARRHGIDLGKHRAIDWRDFKILPGDLFLVMEIRQAHEVRRRLGGRDDVFVALLGLWCKPAVPHLHDPFTLSDAYFDTCFERVDHAVRNLGKALRTPAPCESDA